MYQLNVQQLSLLKKHYQEGQYDAAYTVITDSVSSDYSAYKWFDLATSLAIFLMIYLHFLVVKLQYQHLHPLLWQPTIVLGRP
ncbi:hypothetical protein [Vibrio hepatarius]|uniref:hypothetical protein n=1 Tax=Vibrio hepatarius TaxID=171383 RepID=UPI001C0A51A1|nr:hypothetical protein [Vibrio hepatarius]MBU2895902.1 hypothetical protein [Vibrio hepatarius]